MLRKTRHWTNFGFSYFCDTTRNEVRQRLGALEALGARTKVSAEFSISC